jgi:hypothetical protein
MEMPAMSGELHKLGVVTSLGWFCKTRQGARSCPGQGKLPMTCPKIKVSSSYLRQNTARGSSV